MSLVNAIADWKRLVNNGGFGVNVTLTPPGSSTSKIVKGIAVKHHTSVSTDGLPVNSINVHVSIIESDLIALSYTVRNAAGEVDLRNHRASFADANGTTKNYIIKETMPDETVGLITCILGRYGS
jgi:hypothetical protein